jgi:hypothetical protein
MDLSWERILYEMKEPGNIHTVKPLCIVFKGDKKKKRIWENDSTGKPLKIIDKNNLMIIITSC